MILITDDFTTEARVQLELHFGKDQLRFLPQPQPTAKDLEGAKALLIRSRSKMHKALLENAKDLQLIISATSGLDHIDEAYCLERGIKVLHTPEANVQSVVEHVFLLILQLLKHPNITNKKNWKNHQRGQELSGKTLGIIGLGRIGSRVAKMARTGFGLEVIAYDPYQNFEQFVRSEVQQVGLSELLRLADIVSLHVPLTKETHKMINNKTLELVTKG